MLSAAPRSYAIPAFSRQYATSCTTCHLDFPKLNDFGKAFKDAGFKVPTDDDSFFKIPAVMLGAPAQRDVWPHTVWPGQIPGISPLGFRMNNFFQYTGANRNQFNALAAEGTVPQVIPRTDFQTGLFSIFSAGNFGSDIAFWVDADINVGGNNAAGGLGDGYLKFVNAGRFLKVLGRALMQMGRSTEAIPHLVAALPADSDGSLHFQLSRAYQETGQAEKAAAAMKTYQAMQKPAGDAEIVITGPRR